MAAVPGLLRRWNPGIIPGLSSWYDGSDPASVTLAAGCNISQLRDKSGYRTRHLTQDTLSNQPKYNTTINGLSSINFTGSNVFMSTISATFPNSLNSNSLSHFMIVRTTSNYNFNPAVNTVNLFQFNSSNNSIYTGLGYHISGANNNLRSINPAPLGNLNITVSNNPYTYMAQSYFNKLDTNLYLTTLTAQVTSGPTTRQFSNITSYNIGSINNGAQFAGSFGEIISYSNYYYDYNEHLIIEGYLAWKWGLVSQLGSNHPYKLRPPT